MHALFAWVAFLWSLAASSSSALPPQLSLLLLYPPSGLVAGPLQWEDCGDPSYLAHIRSVTISPDPPVAGENVTIIAEAILDGDVEDGAMVDVVVKLGFIKLLQKTFDICAEAKQANASIQCPVEKGYHKITETVELPKVIPRGLYKLQADAYTVDEDDLLCLKATLDFRL